MARRFRQVLVDRLLPSPESGQAHELDRVLRRGSPGARIRALRQASVLAEAPPPKLLLSRLQDPVPGLRRAAAWALGRGPRSGPVLHRVWEALRRERSDTVRLAMAVAALRLGAEPGRTWELLHEAAVRRLQSWYGPKLTGQASGAGPDAVARQWFRVLAPDADHHGDPASVRLLPSEDLRAELRRRLQADPEDRATLLDLAAQQHPADFDLLLARRKLAGRRESHAICEALGLHGDPRATPHLLEVLRAMDVDPGHGFAGRRASAVALGRLGDPDIGPALVRALADEAHDHEGRPGAGMGIQFPVRSVILAALGEAGCSDQAELLCTYLADTTGSALGGFYLPAMDALWKVGPPALLESLLDGPELVACNALGVLAGQGRLDAVRARTSDPRARVAEVARQALAGAQGAPKEPSAS